MLEILKASQTCGWKGAREDRAPDAVVQNVPVP